MPNYLTRTISGLAFILVMVAGLLVNEYTYALLIVFMIIFMMHEFYEMTMGKNEFKTLRIFAMICGVFIFGLMFAHRIYDCHIDKGAGVIPVILLIIATIYAKKKSDFGKVAYLFTGLAYIALPLSYSTHVVFRSGEYNGLLLLLFFILIWCSDVGAFCLGCTLGRNGKKLFPSISPNKSWWGFFGGLLFAEAGAAILHFSSLLDFPLVNCLVLAAIMHVFGVYGDLFESQWKRFCGVKDSGRIIPGHGGLLDRFDSSILAIPAGVLYLIMANLF